MSTDSLGRLIHSYQTDNGTVQQRTDTGAKATAAIPMTPGAM